MLVRDIGTALSKVICLDERSTLWPWIDGNPPSIGEMCKSLLALPLRITQADAEVRALQKEVDDEVASLYAATASIEVEGVAALACELIQSRSEMRHDALTVHTELDAQRRVVSFAIGLLFGRWVLPETLEPDTPAWLIRTMRTGTLDWQFPKQDVYADDEGTSADIVKGVQSILAGVPLEEFFATDVLRNWMRRGFFEWHMGEYSEARRKAPIYWQLATPSASYSIWLYIHAFNKDTLFRVQNDHVAPKLAHEERRLQSLATEFRDRATAAQRRQLAAQETIVEELRAFLEEVRRVAPLWNPDLADGVIINFAPLWRLVPHHKAWQKELKSTWDALCDGEYDWAHLAMRLWPERVVPKCVTDRSLAIAHGVEDVFWVEGADSKWLARKTSTRSVEELVRERTSPAVKAALKSLLEAPAATGNLGRGGRRRAAATA
jgi:hypothetical protein